MIQQRINFLLLLCLIFGSLPAHAGGDKPIHMEADEVTIDDARQISVFNGNVRLSQGALVITGDQVAVVGDKNGFRHGTITGQLASFHQRQGGSSEYVQGYGERIEYDAINEVMDIFGQGHVRRGLDDVQGNHITYNARTEIFRVSSAIRPDATTGEKEQRVRVVIQPPDSAASSVPGESLTIKPDTSLIKPRN